MQTKAGHLLFSMIKRRASNMAQRDEDVVMELIGMWTKEGKFEEVIKICDRLLAHDPDNNVVKLFKAKAADNEDLKRLYTSLKEVFKKGDAEQKGTLELLPSIDVKNEKVVLEVMDKFYQEGNYK